jgi:hypothetical protein
VSGSGEVLLPQIKLGEPRRLRPAAVKLAVAQEREQKEAGEIDHHHRGPENMVAAEEPDGERPDDDRCKPGDGAMGDPRTVAKHGDEGEEIERER